MYHSLNTIKFELGMIRIDCKLQKFNEVNLLDIIHFYAVYVIWDGKAKKKATYIGYSENVATRLFDHANNWLKFPINGYVAFFEDKEVALLLEALLIDIGTETDRLQDHNRKSESLKLIEKFYKKHGMVKINVSGFDPFSAPKSSKEIQKQIIIDDDDSYFDDFRKRKKS